MNDQTPTEAPASSKSKPRFRNPLRKSDNTTNDSPSKAKTLASKAKNAAAVVGVVAVAGVVAASIAKKKSAKVELTLPDVNVTTEDN